MKNCIYKIIALRTGKIYIGSCVSPIKRKSLHFRHLLLNKHHNIKLQRYVNKYGIDSIAFEIIEHSLSTADLVAREQSYIDTLDPFFNICKIAGSVIGRKHSIETKNKISKSLTNKEYTEERKRNMSAGRKGVKPKPFTEDHKKNMSIAMKGRKKIPFTQERKDKLSNIWKKKRELKSSTSH